MGMANRLVLVLSFVGETRAGRQVPSLGRIILVLLTFGTSRTNDPKPRTQEQYNEGSNFQLNPICFSHLHPLWLKRLPPPSSSTTSERTPLPFSSTKVSSSSSSTTKHFHFLLPLLLPLQNFGISPPLHSLLPLQLLEQLRGRTTQVHKVAESACM